MRTRIILLYPASISQTCNKHFNEKLKSNDELPETNQLKPVIYAERDNES